MFGCNRSKPGGLHTTCKGCKSKLDKAYRLKNKDKIKKTKQQYYLDHKQECIDRAYRNIVNNRERVRMYSRTSKVRIKRQVFTHYCKSPNIQCRYCGEDDIDILTIDHINGGGNRQQRDMGWTKRGGYSFYFWLKRNGFPDGYQVLCMGCQYRKRRKEMAPENPTEEQQRKAAKVQELKVECLNHYGGLVCPCGENDLVLLTLDHVNDDGAKHRREVGARGFGFYVHLRKHGFPNDPPLRVLCIKCQFRKRAKNEEEIHLRNKEVVERKRRQEEGLNFIADL